MQPSFITNQPPNSKFKENPEYEKPNGEPLFDSRSPAIVALVVFRSFDSNGDFSDWVPAANRAPNLTEPKKLGITCGYMGYNETAAQAVIREIYEEVGINIEAAKVIAGDNEQPYYTMTDPNDNPRQDITLRFRYMVRCDELPPLRPSKETIHPRWINLAEALVIEPQEWAFNHHSLLSETALWAKKLGEYNPN